MLFLASEGHAQSTTATPTAATTSLTPAMSSSSVAAFFSALATTAPQQPGSGSQAGDAGSANSGVNSAAGAAGSDTGSITLSRGAIIAIVIVVSCVVIFGSKFSFPYYAKFLHNERRLDLWPDTALVASAVLYYIAKKRSWEVRKSIRRSARKVATALTPRRSEFPRSVKRSSRAMTRIDEVPPTPRTRSNDVEKANGKLTSFEISEPAKPSRWKKFGI